MTLHCAQLFGELFFIFLLIIRSLYKKQYTPEIFLKASFKYHVRNPIWDTVEQTVIRHIRPERTYRQGRVFFAFCREARLGQQGSLPCHQYPCSTNCDSPIL